MATGIINTKKPLTGTVTGGGTNDHDRLINKELADQHPITAITDLKETLNKKLDSETALPLIEEATKGKAKGLYYDVQKELAKKAYWYLTSEIDPITGQGTKASIISGPYDLGAGGGGGGGGSITDVVLRNTDPDTGESLWPSATAIGSTCIAGVYWTSKRDGEPTGNGTMYLYINDKLISKKSVKQGKVTYDISEYVVSGDNKIEFKVVDAYSSVKNLIGSFVGVELKLESKFEDDISYSGDINYTYIPTGNVTKEVYFIVDDEEVGHDTIKISGEQCTHIIKALSHGAHTLRVYFTVTIGGEEVTSNELFYDLICYKPGVNTPIIASTFEDSSEQEQYIAFTIPYRVYTPGKNTSNINLYVDGIKYGTTLNVDIKWHTWEYKPLTVGEHTLAIKCGSVTRTFTVDVKETTIDVEVVKQNLCLELTTDGRSNSESPEERVKWQDITRGINCELTGFNWSSNGWVEDEYGNTVLRLSGDARVEIPYKPFNNDFLQSGKTFEFEIATNDVKNYESRILECITGGDTLTKRYSLAGEDTRTKVFELSAVDNDKFIAKVTGVHKAYIFDYSGTTWMLDGEDVGDLSVGNDFGITLRTIDKEQGATPTEFSDYFMQGDRLTIIYEVAGRGFYITPQLAKLQSQLTSLSTQYKENETVRLAFVVEKRTENQLIYMYINGVMSGVSVYPLGDSFLQTPASNIYIGSNDATIDIYNIRMYDNSLNRRQIVNNWVADTRDATLKADRYHDNDNFDESGKIIINKLPGKTPYMVLTGEQLPKAKKDKKQLDVEFVYPGEDGRYFTSEQATADVQGTSSQYYKKKNFKIKFENGFTDVDGNTEKKYKIVPPLAKKEKTFTFKADVASSEGANNVELVRYFEATKNFLTPAEKDQDPEDTRDGYKTSDRIRVGIDGFPMVMFHNNGNETSFYGKMNFNNDKGNDSTFGFTDGDECWEFTNNNNKLVLFQDNDMSIWEESFESRYPETNASGEAYGKGEGELSKLTAVVDWVVSTRRLDTDTEEQKQAKLNKFKREFTNYFDLRSSLFYYLYTELFLMVDSRAKNAMLAYLHTHNAGDGGNKWFWMPYDMDTAIGINNEGLLVFNYDVEDTDIVDGALVFNGQKSTFWNNVRDAFQKELQDMYSDLRSGNKSGYGGDVVWSYDEIEKRFEEHQSYWSASIFNEDSYEKYLEPYINDNDSTYLGMAQGSKAEQRKWWLFNRFRYLDSKYKSGDARGTTIFLRAYKKSDFEITPFINCYLTAVFDQDKAGYLVSSKAKKDEKTVLVSPTAWDPADTDSVVVLYSADELKDIGDISGFKPGFADFSKATKLQKLKIGSTEPGYSNDKLTGIKVGNNHLLTVLDARNCTALGLNSGKTSAEVTTVPDLSNCTSIEEVYFENTQIQGVEFPVGGNLKKVHLPGTLKDLTIRSHPLLNDLIIEDTSALESIWLEDIPSTAINAIDIVSAMPLGSVVRLINIQESVDSYTKIQDFYSILDNMRGKDGSGIIVNKAQITGKIHVPSIPYADYVTLSEKYPEVTIDADLIICTVEFYVDGNTFNTQSVVLGESAEDPGTPSKEDTQQYHYTFNSWDKSFENVQENLEINAIFDATVRSYRINFNTESRAVATPSYEDILYGSFGTAPELSNIPEHVTFLGWYTDLGDLFVFDEMPIYDNIILHAKWQDESSPVVELNRNSYNKFDYHCVDNVGIVAWAVTNSSYEPTIWTTIETTQEFNGTYEISSEGHYYFWVKDAYGNTGNNEISAKKINYLTGEGISEINLREGELNVSNFALTGTEFIFDILLDEHHKNLVISVSDVRGVNQFNNGDTYTVDSDLTLTTTSTRKNYTVSFDTLGRGSYVPSQTIVYNYTAVEPDPQYDNRYVIKEWCTDTEMLNIFDFDTPITGDITLYAHWVHYDEPTKTTINLTESNTDITITFLQTVHNGTEINWGDGSDTEVCETGTDGYVQKTHTYAEPGEYVIKTTLLEGMYYLGRSFEVQFISPIDVVTRIEFGWDITHTNPYAFKGAVNLLKTGLTDYMTSIAIGTYQDCTSLTSFDLTKNIKQISAYSFRGCVNIFDDLIINNKLEEIGDYAFDGCTKLRRISLINENCSLGRYCFRYCSGLTGIPNNLKTFTQGLFSNCSGLVSVVLSEDVKELPGQTFAYCSNLESVKILNKNMTFGTGMNFTSCPNLTTAGPIGGDYSIEFAFDEYIPERAFMCYVNADSSALSTIVLPVGIVKIGKEAFFGCGRLREINLPDTLKTIEKSAFARCSLLTTITIPFSVTSMGENMLSGCIAMRDVYIKATSSNTLINTYIDSWFLGMYSFTTAHIPSILDTAEKAASAYGSAWNLCSGTGSIRYTNDIE